MERVGEEQEQVLRALSVQLAVWRGRFNHLSLYPFSPLKCFASSLPFKIQPAC